jgi:HEAT repeat protein
MTARERRQAVIVAGHTGDAATALDHLADADSAVRVAALGALERLGQLANTQLTAAFDDESPDVRRRAAELAGKHPGISLLRLLRDADGTVVEVAAWACGEQETVEDDVLDRLIELATESDEPLVREASAAALGAIGDERGLPAVLAACVDKPNVRRRAVLALAPFDGLEVDAAIEQASADRDWQVRQAAEDLRRAAGEFDLS